MLLCSKGHEQTEENVTWVKRGDRPGLRRRCKLCKRQWGADSRGGYKDTPSRSEMLRQATDFLHEDIEDLLNYGATYEEIIDRGGYANWGNMYKSLKRRERHDLIERLRAKKALATTYEHPHSKINGAQAAMGRNKSRKVTV